MILVAAALLRPLPLSVAGLVTGNAFAIPHEVFCPYIFFGTLLTAIVFQILSNFANDYGDGMKGTDNQERIGPKRVLQQKLISPKTLFRGIVISMFVGFFMALATVSMAFEPGDTKNILTFLGLAVVAIVAAYKYTAGIGAYGYHALGDVFVFAFFGLLAVGGSFYLQTKKLEPNIWWFAFAIGGLSTAVLNLNNIRDMKNDTRVGKKTVAAYLGLKSAKTYHCILVLGSITSLTVGLINIANGWITYMPLLMVFPILLQLMSTIKFEVDSAFDALIKPLALSIFGTSILFLITQIIGLWK